MKVRRKHATLRVDLLPQEAALLGDIFDDLAELLSTDDAPYEQAAGSVDPVIARLYPDGYTDDDEASAEFRQLVAADLRAERCARIQACRAELPVGGGRFELDDEAADRWIRVINDVRLALGTRLGVSETEELDPAAESTVLYHWLSGVQEMLVMHLMG
ncbi:DUF2017 family protein [Jatrophihabitans sp. DSM 45814]